MTTVADHLLDRLAELGADRVFGVPGDYSLTFLDHVVDHPRIGWTGCAGELGAGYAADGYARMRGIGVVATTFGVGELSAVNALAGSYAEQVPVVEIVGAPSTRVQAGHGQVHHTLGDGVFTHFLRMHEPVTCARAVLTPEDPCAQVDRVLAAVRDHRLPGYLVVPADLADLPVVPPSGPLPSARDATDPAALAAFRRALDRLLGSTSGRDDVVVVGGLLVHRFGVRDELRTVLDTGVDHAITAWAKSLVDESRPNFVGTYEGSASDEAVRSRVEQAPVLVLAGVRFTDLNSGFFTQHLGAAGTVDLGPGAAVVAGERFAPVALADALTALAASVDRLAPRTAPTPHPTASAPAGAAHPGTAPRAPVTPSAGGGATAPPDPDAPLTQEALWDAVTADLLAGDIVLADQGTAFYGMAPHPLPADVTFLGQPLWASIGYTLPAMLGACLAVPGSRGVLLVGDGAAQLTVQELGTVAAHALSATVVLVDNDGYTIERAIHGPEQPYNDAVRWDWSRVGDFLAPGLDVRTVVAGSAGTLRAALAAARRHEGLSVVVARVPRDDVPPLLAAVAAAAAGANAPSAR